MAGSTQREKERKDGTGEEKLGGGGGEETETTPIKKSPPPPSEEERRRRGWHFGARTKGKFIAPASLLPPLPPLPPNLTTLWRSGEISLCLFLLSLPTGCEMQPKPMDAFMHFPSNKKSSGKKQRHDREGEREICPPRFSIPPKKR